MLENQVKRVYLSLGSNLGNKKINLINAKFLLESSNHIKILKISNYYKTDSWPDKKKPFFLNIAIEVKTNLNPVKLFKLIKNIENRLGRKKGPKNSPRTLDIDILDYDQKEIFIKFKKDNLVIPHPRMHTRNFVLLPLFEISKTWNHPKSGKKITKLLASLKMDNLRCVKFE